MINVKIQPTQTPNLSPNITVIGVGGGGGNAVNNMKETNVEGCEFLVCNTDAQALDKSLCENKIQLGSNVTGGLGAGANPEVGRAAAEESLEEVLQYVDGSNMVFVTAGMGGGTGTGAAPVIAKACRERGILTVGVVTKPFHFEGAHRMKSAETGIEEMQKYVDTLIVIPNQNLFRIANEKTTFAEAFRMADGVLQSGVRGVTDLMVRPGLVNLDFADIRTAMMEMGKAMMGTGEASGEKRAIEAAEAAINNPLLDDVSMKGARGVIINVTGGYDMTLFEADEACNRIRDEVDPDANIIFGATFDDNMEGAMRVSIVATGIERNAAQGSGSNGGFKVTSTTGGGGNGGGLKRAVPNTNTNAQMRQNAQTIVQPPASMQPQSAPAPQPAMMPAAATMSAPVMAASQPPQNVQSAVAQSATVQAAPEPNLDMFEQSEFMTASEQSAATEAQNTALRGTRYKNAFIPPKPITASEPAKVPGFHASQSTSASSAPMRAETAQSGSGLKLNPPKLPVASEQKRTPSLLERITGSVQEKLEGIKQEYAPHKQNDVRVPPSTTTVSSTPSQGSLNIDAPSKPASSDGDLDIPAFLRRQAN